MLTRSQLSLAHSAKVKTDIVCMESVRWVAVIAIASVHYSLF